jgi:hypothetical protein
MMHRNKGSLWLGAISLAAGALVSGCSSSDTAEDATTMVSQAVESVSDSSDAVEVSSLMKGLNALRPQAVEGFHCDASPDITNIEVCGKSLPATVHLEWTDCAAPPRREGGRRPGGTATTDGLVSGATTSGGGRMGGGQAPAGAPGGEAPPAHDGTCSGGPHFGPSSGSVDISYTYVAPENCTGAVQQNQAVSFEISRTAEDGSVSKVSGTTASSADLVDGAPPQQKATQADVTRTRIDAAGTVVSSVHLTGSMNVAFSSDTPPVRTVNGSYTEAFLDGSTGTVTLDNIVKQPRNVCPWPTSGSLVRATSDGATHTLAFGPECGAATLDGTAVELPEHHPGHRGGGR